MCLGGVALHPKSCRGIALYPRSRRTFPGWKGIALHPKAHSALQCVFGEVALHPELCRASQGLPGGLPLLLGCVGVGVSVMLQGAHGRPCTQRWGVVGRAKEGPG